MALIPILLKEMAAEAATTRKMLALVPNDKFGWKPHEKSMTMQQLAAHIAEMPGWVTVALHTTELDFAKGDYQPEVVNNNAELLECFERNLADGIKNLEAATEEDMHPMWTMRSGEHIISTMEKHEMIRISISQTIHHRAQLGVYLRLLDIPLPGSYGPTADSPNF